MTPATEAGRKLTEASLSSRPRVRAAQLVGMKPVRVVLFYDDLVIAIRRIEAEAAAAERAENERLRAAGREYVAARDAYVRCDDDLDSDEPCGHWYRQRDAFDALRAALEAATPGATPAPTPDD